MFKNALTAAPAEARSAEAHALIDFRIRAYKAEREVRRLTAENHRLRVADAQRLVEIEKLEKQNFDLMMALLDASPVECPGEGFPDEPAPHVDPPPEHPDFEDRHVIIAARALDQRLAA
jgi:hypothetical protein